MRTDHSVAMTDEDRKPMSPQGRVIFDAFTAAAREVPLPTVADVEPIALQCKASLTAQAIAVLLGDLEQARVGIPVERRLGWLEIGAATRERLRLVSERCVKQSEPGFRVTCAEEAVAEFDLWLNGPGEMPANAPTDIEKARKAIGFFCEQEDQ